MPAANAASSSAKDSDTANEREDSDFDFAKDSDTANERENSDFDFDFDCSPHFSDASNRGTVPFCSNIKHS